MNDIKVLTCSEMAERARQIGKAATEVEFASSEEHYDEKLLIGQLAACISRLSADIVALWNYLGPVLDVHERKNYPLKSEESK